MLYAYVQYVHMRFIAHSVNKFDDHFLIPFPLSVPAFRFRFPFQLSVSSVSTYPYLTAVLSEGDSPALSLSIPSSLLTDSETIIFLPVLHKHTSVITVMCITTSNWTKLFFFCLRLY